MQQNTLKPIPILVAGDMSGNLTSSVINVQYLNEGYLQIIFSGAPVGTFQVQCSSDYVSASDPFRSLPPNDGHWDNMDLGTTLSASGSAGTISVDITLTGVSFIRLVYTFASGTGSASANFSGKQL